MPKIWYAHIFHWWESWNGLRICIGTGRKMEYEFIQALSLFYDKSNLKKKPTIFFHCVFIFVHCAGRLQTNTIHAAFKMKSAFGSVMLIKMLTLVHRSFFSLNVNFLGVFAYTRKVWISAKFECFLKKIWTRICKNLFWEQINFIWLITT